MSCSNILCLQYVYAVEKCVNINKNTREDVKNDKIFLLHQVDGLNSLHSVKATPNRFTKTSQGRSWNTGNGSPDAICLTVDKPGIVLVGVCVYGGGGIHEYELEVLADDVRDCFSFTRL